MLGPLPVIQGRAWLTQGRGHTTGDAGTSLTHREMLVSDAAHGEAVVARVHSAGQHLVQVHVGASVQQRTLRTAHAQDQRRLPSLLPSGAAAAQGRQPRQRRRQEPELLSWGPELIPSPGWLGLEGAGPKAGGAPVRAPVTTRAGPGEAPVHSETSTPAGSTARKAELSTHFWGLGA